MTFFAPYAEQAADRRTVLVTGATGVVGTALLPRLAATHRVIALAHRRITPGGVVTVHGDVTRPLLGLARDRYAALAERVEVIVHAAADTEPASTGYQPNVVGTRHVLDLAEASGATVHFLSPAATHRGAGSNYLRGKRIAEQLVRDSGVPATIVRPSAVIGDAQTGEIAAFRGISALTAAVLGSAMPVLPLDPRDRIDTVPVDVLARTLASLVDSGTAAGEYWITAGSAALTAERWLEILVDVGDRLGIPVTPPRLHRPGRLLPSLAPYADPDVLPSDLATLPGGTVLGPQQTACAVEASATYLACAKGMLPLADLAPRVRTRRRALAAA